MRVWRGKRTKNRNLTGKGYASLLRQKRSRKPAFIAVKAADRARDKSIVHRFRAASFAGVLCAKRTAKTGVRPKKMSKLIFPDCRRFSYARKLSLRLPSYRRKLFVIVFKPVRPLRSRRRILLAQRFGGRGGLQRFPLPISVFRHPRGRFRFPVSVSRGMRPTWRNCRARQFLRS